MRLLAGRRGRADTLQDRLVWQAASLLLAYPDDELPGRLDTVEELLGHIHGPAAALLGQTLAALRAREPMAAAMDYVATFDMRRHCTMYLTYWTAGDTRNRGREMVEFAAAYRESGVQPPRAEAPDHLPVVLEFAATVDPGAGRRLLAEHRVPIDALRARSPTRSRPTSPPWRRCARPCPPRPIRTCAARSAWPRPGRPRKPLGCNPST